MRAPLSLALARVRFLCAHEHHRDSVVRILFGYWQIDRSWRGWARSIARCYLLVITSAHLKRYLHEFQYDSSSTSCISAAARELSYFGHDVVWFKQLKMVNTLLRKQRVIVSAIKTNRNSGSVYVAGLNEDAFAIGTTGVLIPAPLDGGSNVWIAKWCAAHLHRSGTPTHVPTPGTAQRRTRRRRRPSGWFGV